MNLLSAIHTFVKVAELSSYTKAAQQLALSRTQVSQLVMQLEQHLEARLLQRTTRRMQLTEAGERYLLHAKVSRFLDFVSAQWGQPPYWEQKLSPYSKQ